ncbi:hypothetical protein GQX74_007263 [Glossina fuscipes]|nr:hypothetical protein GQX74_007263 [Glossina fuscipes]
MPSKKSKPSAFMMFVNQWREKSANDLSLNDAIAEAGIVWANMNLNERTPFVQSAIVEKQKLQKKKNHYEFRSPENSILKIAIQHLTIFAILHSWSKILIQYKAD